MDDKTAIDALRILVGKCGTDVQVDALQHAIQAIEALERVRAAAETIVQATAHERWLRDKCPEGHPFRDSYNHVATFGDGACKLLEAAIRNQEG
jgi:hypothetical protein